VPALSPNAIAIAVYADAKGQFITAQEAGFEGVACVDDAARALQLYCALWSRTGLAWAKEWCDGLVDFILAMQRDDGRWCNFIKDWDGDINADTRTSVAGGHFWHARAMLALANGRTYFDDERIEDALRRGATHLDDVEVPADVRALHVLTAIALRGQDPRLDFSTITTWCDEIAECRSGDVLMNSPDETGRPHLWGHLQEFALSRASVVLERPDFLDVAERSASAVFDGVIRSGFDQPQTSPYDVATSVLTMSELATTTKNLKFDELHSLAREWFHGRNSAGTPVYDVENGRVADGIDKGCLNASSGAESNIEGALALLNEVIVHAGTLDVESIKAPRTSNPKDLS
jgi:hypothetical protein